MSALRHKIPGSQSQAGNAPSSRLTSDRRKFLHTAFLFCAGLGMCLASTAGDKLKAADAVAASAVAAAESDSPMHETAQRSPRVGRLVDLTLFDGTVFVRSLVLAEDDRFITIRFRNAPYSIPWSQVRSLAIVPNS